MHTCLFTYLDIHPSEKHTTVMYNMFRFNGRLDGCLNILRQGVNICLYFCLPGFFCFFVWLAKRCRSFFTFIFCPLFFVSFAPTVRSQCAHSAFTLRSDCVHLRSPPHSIRAHRLQSAHRAFRMRLLCAHRSFTYRSFR